MYSGIPVFRKSKKVFLFFLFLQRRCAERCRSIRSLPERVNKLAKKVISGANQFQLLPCFKHGSLEGLESQRQDYQKRHTMENLYSKLQGIENIFAPEQKPKEWYEEVEEKMCSYLPSMTYQQRIGGCLMFMVLGFLISMGSTMRIISLIEGNPVPFATMYSTGNIISICATCFLYGPWTQAKKMFAPTRAIATLIYLGFMGLTLFLAFYGGHISYRTLLLVLCIISQFLALCWYTLSFIPFARDIVLTCIKEGCCKCGLPSCCEEREQDPFWG